MYSIDAFLATAILRFREIEKECGISNFAGKESISKDSEPSLLSVMDEADFPVKAWKESPLVKEIVRRREFDDDLARFDPLDEKIAMRTFGVLIESVKNGYGYETFRKRLVSALRKAEEEALEKRISVTRAKIAGVKKMIAKTEEVLSRYPGDPILTMALAQDRRMLRDLEKELSEIERSKERRI